MKREALGLSLRNLASKLEVTHPTILAWERDESAPKGARFFRLANALGVHATWLRTGKGPEDLQEEGLPRPLQDLASTELGKQLLGGMEAVSEVLNWARTQPDYQEMRRLSIEEAARIRSERGGVEGDPQARDPYMGPAIVMVEAALSRRQATLSAFSKGTLTFEVYLGLRRNPDAVTEAWVDSQLERSLGSIWT